ncbi:CRISPR-associated RAMP Cmr6 family protein [mine drainage metagenome]|uniref:CRISPR-associated RAMP Cmr6 family protein n=1 Tax=mine drainage metagenome TaxID=410659 RepID=T1C4M9_9ZZZZ
MTESKSGVAVPWYVGDKFKEAPPGHRYLLYLPFWESDWNPKKGEKQQVLKSLGAIRDCPSASKVMHALAERQRAIGKAVRALVIEAVSTSPFVTGLGWGHPNDNGFAFLNPYGLPYLAASGVKGVLRRATEELALFEPSAGITLLDVWWLFGFEGASGDIWKSDGPWADAFVRHKSKLLERPDLPLFLGKLGVKTDRTVLFAIEEVQRKRHDLQYRGALRFFDVMPEVSGDGMDVDIMNPHYVEYYQGKSTPHDADNPVPIFFMVVPPESTFTFVVDCPLEHQLPEGLRDGWRDMVRASFDHAFDWLGFGAKTAVGYGVIQPDQAQQEKYEAREREADETRRKAIEREAELATLSPIDRRIREFLDARCDKNQSEIAALIGAVKQGHWHGEERTAVAIWLRTAMQRNKKWKESSCRKNPAKDHDYQDTLLIKEWLNG